MSIITKLDAFAAEQAIHTLVRERRLALSRREWKHRIAGYGYRIRETEAGGFIERMGKRAVICALPTDLAV